MNLNNIKIWLLFQLRKHLRSPLRNSLQLLILTRDLTKLVQLATTQRCQLSSLKHLFMTSLKVKFKESYLSIMNKLITTKHGTRIQVLGSMISISWAKSNSILPVKTRLSNLKSQTVKMRKKNQKPQAQELTKH